MNLDAIDYLLCNFAGGADTEEFDDFFLIFHLMKNSFSKS